MSLGCLLSVIVPLCDTSGIGRVESAGTVVQMHSAFQQRHMELLDLQTY